MNIKVDDKAVRNSILRQMRNRAKNTRPAMEIIGAKMLADTMKNFSKQSNPAGMKWQALKATTLDRRRKEGKGGKILMDIMTLRNSIAYKAYQKKVDLFTNLVYSAVHQYGYPKRNIPARPYMGFIDRTTASYQRILTRWVMDGRL